VGLAFAHVIGAAIMASLASTIAWGNWHSWVATEVRDVVMLSIMAYALAAVATARMTSLPRSAPLAAIVISTTFLFAAALAALASLRLPYSRLYISCAWLLANVCQAAAYGVQPRVYPRFAFLPGKVMERLRSIPGASWIPIDEADHAEVDAVVLDPGTASSPQWTAALAQWKLDGLKLIDGRAVYEMFTGRVLLDTAHSTQIELTEPRLFYPAYGVWWNSWHFCWRFR